jgi:hypothetical protein
MVNHLSPQGKTFEDQRILAALEDMARVGRLSCFWLATEANANRNQHTLRDPFLG